MLRVIVQAGEHYLRYSSCDTAKAKAAGQEDNGCRDIAQVANTVTDLWHV